MNKTMLAMVIGIMLGGYFSISISYAGNCDHSWQQAKDGSSCGGRAAGSTPFSRTVVKRLKTSDSAWRVYVASVNCGTARCNRIGPSAPYPAFDKSYDSLAPV